MNTTLVIPHIPKTGGTSLRRHFDEHLEFNRTFIHQGPWGENRVASDGGTLWTNMPSDEQKEAEVIIGHKVKKDQVLSSLSGNRLLYATCIREPAERWVSDYNFQRGINTISESKSFWEFYFQYSNRNTQVNFLWNQFLGNKYTSNHDMLNHVIEELANFDCVGIMERYQPFLDQITDWLHLPRITQKFNVTGISHDRILTVDDEIRNKIKEDCEFDYKLYYWARDKAV